MTTEQDPTGAPSPEPMPAAARRADGWRRPFIGPFTVAQVAAVVGAVLLTAFALIVLTSPLNVPPAATPPRPGSSFVAVGSAQPGLRVGDLAPELVGTANGQTVELTDLGGNPIRLADLRGRPVWINFWATWCPPCQEETPILRDMHEQYADDGLAVVAISVQETTIEDVRDYVDRYDLGYTVGFDATSAIFHTYRAFGLPTQLFLDREGVIRQVVLGPITRSQAEETIADLLGRASSPSPTPPSSP